MSGEDATRDPWPLPGGLVALAYLPMTAASLALAIRLRKPDPTPVMNASAPLVTA